MSSSCVLNLVLQTIKNLTTAIKQIISDFVFFNLVLKQKQYLWTKTLQQQEQQKKKERK